MSNAANAALAEPRNSASGRFLPKDDPLHAPARRMKS